MLFFLSLSLSLSLSRFFARYADRRQRDIDCSCSAAPLCVAHCETFRWQNIIVRSRIRDPISKFQKNNLTRFVCLYFARTKLLVYIYTCFFRSTRRLMRASLCPRYTRLPSSRNSCRTNWSLRSMYIFINCKTFCCVVLCSFFLLLLLKNFVTQLH